MVDEWLPQHYASIEFVFSDIEVVGERTGVFRDSINRVIQSGVRYGYLCPLGSIPMDKKRIYVTGRVVVVPARHPNIVLCDCKHAI